MKITEEQLETLCFWFHKHWRMGDYTEEQRAMWKAIDNLTYDEYDLGMDYTYQFKNQHRCMIYGATRVIEEIIEGKKHE